MNLLNQINKKSIIVYGIGIVFIILTYEIGINYYIVPSVIFDEIGYWSSAAYFAGYDWSGILSYTSYYGYGMGLILSLFMRFIKDPVFLYQTVLQLQVFMIIGIYLISMYVLNLLSNKKSVLSNMLISIIVISYPALQMNAKLVWSECFIMFFTWLSLYLFVRYIEKKKGIYAICLGVVLGYLYMIHLRNVGSICLVIILMLGIAMLERNSLKQTLSCIITVLIMIIIACFLKGVVQREVFYTCGNLEKANSSAVANDYSGRISALLSSISEYGVTGILFSFIGKMYYMMVATLGFGLYSFMYILERIKKSMQKRNFDRNSMIVFYIFLFFAGSICISILSTPAVAYGARGDSLVYGRYMEHTFPMLVMLGLHYLFSRNIRMKTHMIISTFILVTGIAVYNIYHLFEFNGWINICIPALNWGYINIGEFKWVLFYSICVINIIMLCALLKRKGGGVKLSYIFIIIVFLLISQDTIGIVHNLQSNLKKNVDLVEKIKEVNYKVPIYCVRKDDPYLYVHVCDVQFLLPDYHVSYITEEQSQQLQGEYYLLVESMDDYKKTSLKRVYHTDTGWDVLVPRRGELSTIISKNGF